MFKIDRESIQALRDLKVSGSNVVMVHSMVWDDIIDYLSECYEQPNEPLTVEELKQMEGEPVFVVPTQNGSKHMGGYCIVTAEHALLPGIEYFEWDFEDYSETWLAYRRKPERTEK